MTVSRTKPSLSTRCRRSTPSRTAPSLAIARWLRSFRPSHLIVTRSQRPPNIGPNAYSNISSLHDGFTSVPRAKAEYHVAPISTDR